MTIVLFLFLILLISNFQILSPQLETKYKNLLGRKIAKTPTSSLTPTSSPTPTFTPSPTPTPTFVPTTTPTPIPVAKTSLSLEELFTKYGSQYNVDKELLKKIAGCESGFDPSQITGIYAGLFQFADFAWTEARGRMGLSSDQSLRFNAEESIRTAAFEINYKGTSGWSDCD